MRQITYTDEEICRFNDRDDLPALAKFLALELYHRDGPGGAFPTRTELARKIGRTDRTVRNLLAILRAAGVVTVEINAGGTAAYRNDRRPNLYHVDLFAGAAADGGKPISTRNDADGGKPISSRERPRGETDFRHGGKPISPEQKKRTKEKDDDARVRVHASNPAPSSSSFVPVRTTCDKAAKRVAASRGKTNGYWRGVITAWQTEQDDRGLTRFDKCRLWLESGADTETVIERLIRNAPLTESVVITGPRSIDHPLTCACHGEGVVKVDDRGQGTYDRCRGMAI